MQDLTDMYAVREPGENVSCLSSFVKWAKFCADAQEKQEIAGQRMKHDQTTQDEMSADTGTRVGVDR